MNPASNSSLKVLRQLGSDAHSDAFLAEVRGFDAPMVVRVVKPELAQNAERMNRFIAEARLLTEVSSPGLLQVRSAGRMKDGQVYVLTDFADGQPLVGTSNLALQELVELGLPLCSALAALHEAGLVLGALNAHEVLSTPRGPMLDASLAPLSRAPGATHATDVRALASWISALAGREAVSDPYELAVRQGLGSATTAGELVSALESARQRWAGHRVRESTEAVVESVTIDEADLSGQTLGPYALQRVLGEGAMGRVYLGQHQQTGAEAAIKVLKAEHAIQKDLVQRFIQEATAINAIQNEHIVEVHDFGEGPSAHGIPRVYCVMEVLHGRPLADEMELGTLPIQRACRIVHQVTHALGAAHALGVVHRDIKPENIYLHQRGADPDYVKVLDFGVAKLLKPLASLPTSNTQKGIVIGTPEYMAPEQALGISTDLRVDLYACGLVLYELLSGDQPFKGNTFGKLVVEITTRPPPPLPAQTAAGEPIPRGLMAIVDRCLQKKPEDRFSSAAELGAALEPFVVPGGSARASAAEADSQALRAAVRPSRTPRLVAAFGLALVLGAVGFYVLRAPPAEAVVAAKTVTLEVASQPAGARVTRLDTQQLLGLTPLKLQTERLEAPLGLRLELAGHAPSERQVELATDVSLSVELVPTP
ncbi:MAG: Serine/threonine protein kinase [Myxococcaceae bacterium]|nr:Serine/threonine protein kinase [Myxococcaceae bacterium]